MAGKNRRGSEEKPSPDVLGPLQDIIRQLREGKLTHEQLQALAEHRNPFGKKEKENPKSVTVRMVQMTIFKERGYDVDEKEVPFPDEEKLVYPGNPLLVDYRTPVTRQCRLLRIENRLYTAELSDLGSAPNSEDRWGWIYGVNDGRLTINQSVYEVKKGLSRGCALTLLEGLALYCIYPDVLLDHEVSFSDTYFYDTNPRGETKMFVPILGKRAEKIVLESVCIESSFPKLGHASKEC